MYAIKLILSRQRRGHGYDSSLIRGNFYDLARMERGILTSYEYSFFTAGALLGAFDIDSERTTF